MKANCLLIFVWNMNSFLIFGQSNNSIVETPNLEDIITDCKIDENDLSSLIEGRRFDSAEYSEYAGLFKSVYNYYLDNLAYELNQDIELEKNDQSISSTDNYCKTFSLQSELSNIFKIYYSDYYYRILLDHIFAGNSEKAKELLFKSAGDNFKYDTLRSLEKSFSRIIRINWRTNPKSGGYLDYSNTIYDHELFYRAIKINNELSDQSTRFNQDLTHKVEDLNFQYCKRYLYPSVSEFFDLEWCREELNWEEKVENFNLNFFAMEHTWKGLFVPKQMFEVHHENHNEKTIKIKINTLENSELQNKIADTLEQAYSLKNKLKIDLIFVNDGTEDVKFLFNNQTPAHVSYDANGPNTINLPTLFSLDNEYDKRTLLHEFGHILGFRDCYKEIVNHEQLTIKVFSLKKNNLMCGTGTKVDQDMLRIIHETYN